MRWVITFSPDGSGSDDVNQHRHRHSDRLVLTQSASSRSNLKVGFRKTIKECSQADWIGSRCALAGLDIMHAAHSTKQLSFIAQAFGHSTELAECAARQAQLHCDSLDKQQLRLGRLIWQFDVPTLA